MLLIGQILIIHLVKAYNLLYPIKHPIYNYLYVFDYPFLFIYLFLNDRVHVVLCPLATLVLRGIWEKSVLMWPFSAYLVRMKLLRLGWILMVLYCFICYWVEKCQTGIWEICFCINVLELPPWVEQNFSLLMPFPVQLKVLSLTSDPLILTVNIMIIKEYW